MMTKEYFCWLLVKGLGIFYLWSAVNFVILVPILVILGVDLGFGHIIPIAQYTRMSQLIIPAVVCLYSLLRGERLCRWFAKEDGEQTGAVPYLWALVRMCRVIWVVEIISKVLGVVGILLMPMFCVSDDTVSQYYLKVMETGLNELVLRDMLRIAIIFIVSAFILFVKARWLIRVLDKAITARCHRVET